jgi:hypothetical protein
MTKPTPINDRRRQSRLLTLLDQVAAAGWARSARSPGLIRMDGFRLGRRVRGDFDALFPDLFDTGWVTEGYRWRALIDGEITEVHILQLTPAGRQAHTELRKRFPTQCPYCGWPGGCSCVRNPDA